MRKILVFTILIISVIDLKSQDNIDLPYDFEKKAFEHIERLSGFGIRSAGTDAELKTIEYLINEFQSIGLTTKIDTFQFKCFLLNEKIIKSGNEKFSYDKIIFNPYVGIEEIQGKLHCFHPDSSYDKLPELNDKIILTTKPSNIWKLTDKKPKAIVFTNQADFENQLYHDNKIASINVSGHVKEYKTYNIVASTNDQIDKEIVVSAHWDSYRGPGANDNASGIGVMVEIARFIKNYDKNYPVNFQFVAFGGEELGMIGSKAFIENYQQELMDCIFNFNIDNVGGTVGPFIALKGKQNIDKSDNVSFDLIARTDFNENWIASGHEFHLSIPTVIPDWLNEDIVRVADSLGIEIKPVGDMGSDHRIFAYIGIPSTNMCIGDEKVE